MHRVIFCICISICCMFSAKAEVMIINGDTTCFSVKTSPLEQHPDIDRIRKFLMGYESDKCFDCTMVDYKAEWTLIDNRLYLTGIYPANTKKTGEKADINKIFNVTNKRVNAAWVTTEFWLPIGKALRSRDMWSVYGAELLLEIKNGRIVKQQELKYPTEPRLEPNEMQKFIYTTIQWNKIPNLGKEQKMLFFSFEAGDTGKPEKVVIQRKTDCEICNEEALRALTRMPWPPDYREGKIVPLQYSMPIVFSEERRKKYVY